MDIKPVKPNTNQAATVGSTTAKTPALPKPPTPALAQKAPVVKPAPVAPPAAPKPTVPTIAPAGKATITVTSALSSAKDASKVSTPTKPGYIKPVAPVTAMPSAGKTLATKAIVTPSKPSDAFKLKGTATTPAKPTAPASKAMPQSSTMPHKSHFGIAIAIGIIVLGLAAGGLYLLSGKLSNPLSSRGSAVATPIPDQSYKEADTQLQQLDADLKDSDARFNDKAGDLTEN